MTFCGPLFLYLSLETRVYFGYTFYTQHILSTGALNFPCYGIAWWKLANNLTKLVFWLARRPVPQQKACTPHNNASLIQHHVIYCWSHGCTPSECRNGFSLNITAVMWKTCHFNFLFSSVQIICLTYCIMVEKHLLVQTSSPYLFILVVPC